ITDFARPKPGAIVPDSADSEVSEVRAADGVIAIAELAVVAAARLFRLPAIRSSRRDVPAQVRFGFPEIRSMVFNPKEPEQADATAT
ncbi:MAG: hypothetical protein ACK58T_05900, partial [Phycisphaerae bacterium]